MRNCTGTLAAAWSRLRARWSVRLAAGLDLIDSLADGKPRDRRFKTYLDVQTLEVRWLPSWTASLYTAAVSDAYQGAAVQAGPVRFYPADGKAVTAVPLDYYKSATPDAFVPQSALYYSSQTVAVRPVIEVELQSTPFDTMPATLTATLTWNGSAQTGVSFSTTGHSAGDSLLVAVQVASAVTTSGVYNWSMDVAIPVPPPGITQHATASGAVAVVARDGSGSPLGAGWGVSGLHQLLISNGYVDYVSDPGLSASDGHVFTTGGGGGLSTVTPPPNEFGDLEQNGNGSYTYTWPNQVKENFDSNGRAVNVVDPHGLALTYSFDGSGRLSQIAAPDGGLTTFSYDAGTGELATVQEPGGRTVTVTVDGSDNLTALNDPAGGLHTFSYDASHRLTEEDFGNQRATLAYDATTHLLGSVDRGGGATTSLSPEVSVGLATSPVKPASAGVAVVTDALSHPTTFTLDVLGRPTRLDSPDGATRLWARDAAGMVTTYTDPLSRVTTYSYDGLSGASAEDVTEVDHPDGGVDHYTYDSTFHRVRTHTDPLNHVTTFGYDATTGDLRTVKDALNHTTTYTWSSGLLQTETDPLGHTTSFGYDASRRLQVTIDALNDRTTYGYDAAGNVSAVTDPLNHTTTTTFDGVRRPLTVTDPLGHTTTYSYDAVGHVSTMTNPLGNQTTYAYDARGNETGMTQAAGAAVQRRVTDAYDALNRLTAATDGNGNTTSYGYDAVGRLVSATDPLNHTTTTVYNLAGDAVQRVDSLGKTTSFSYDAMDRVVTVVPPAGGTTSYGYDLAGNLVTVKDPLGHTATTVYDAVNRAIKQIDALGGTTSLVYDAAGNRTVVVDPVGNGTTAAYDALNRVSSKTDPTNHTATFAYDAAGRLASKTDGAGRRIDYTYDVAGRETGEAWYASGGSLDQTVTYTYDNGGRTLTAANASGTDTFTYDALGRAATAAQPFGLSLTYTYDAADNRTVMQDSQGGVTTYVYDAANRLTSEQFTDGTTPLRFDYTYTVRNQVASVSRYSNLAGTTLVGTTAYTYDDAGRVTNIWHKDSAGASLQNTTYTYDLADRLTSQVVDGTTTSYSYDSTDQLTSDGANSYGYDANGNRNTGSYTTGSGNQITGDGTWTYTYDGAGNLVKKSKGASAETWTYGYDEANRMVWAEDHATDGGAATERVDYTYDALGHRLSRSVTLPGPSNTTTEEYGYDGENVWADLDGSNALVTRRLFGPDTDQMVARITASGGAAAWYLTERQGSVTKVVNASGSAIDTLTYDGFGKVVTESTPASGDRYAYTGRERDSTTGLQYSRARYYNPATGTWESMDPMGFGAGDANLYRYVGNSTTNFVDPTGLLQKPKLDLGPNQPPAPAPPPAPGMGPPLPGGGGPPPLPVFPPKWPGIPAGGGVFPLPFWPKRPQIQIPPPGGFPLGGPPILPGMPPLLIGPWMVVPRPPPPPVFPGQDNLIS